MVHALFSWRGFAPACQRESWVGEHRRSSAHQRDSADGVARSHGCCALGGLKSGSSMGPMTALFVIDTQAGLFTWETSLGDAEGVVVRIKAVAGAVRRNGGAVVFIQHALQGGVAGFRVGRA